MKFLQPTRNAVETDISLQSVSRAVSSRRRIGGRAMEPVDGHESFLALSNRGALSVFDANLKFVRASYLVLGEPWSTVRLEQRSIRRILCLLRINESL